ncbi:TAXI family TRAP transporter solute-binding subunit [Rhodobaculum claviforme]|nr:TAXI family TRAP transporter solute-binding subunit [Rhodobaculum claviforme]
MTRLAILMTGACALVAATGAAASERLTLKSASSSSSYYVMMVQLAELLRAGGTISPTVEESQGSVQNVKEAAVRPGNFLFTSPPSLLVAASQSTGAFEGDPAFDGARTLFVMPYVTMHIVVRADAGIESLSDLAGRTFVPGGTGTFCEGRTRAVFQALELEEAINLVDLELSAAANALRNRQIDGFSTCSSHPTPQLSELATTLDMAIVPFTESEQAAIIALDAQSGPITIAAGTYPGLEADVPSVGVPVGAYATTAMSDDMAYDITRTFWENREALAGERPWWAGVTPDLIEYLWAEVHPGAARYYEEIGVAVPAR